MLCVFCFDSDVQLPQPQPLNHPGRVTLTDTDSDAAQTSASVRTCVHGAGCVAALATALLHSLDFIIIYYGLILFYYLFIIALYLLAAEITCTF